MTAITQLRVPSTHPHIAIIEIDPADHCSVTRLISKKPELRLVHCDDQQPNTWTLYVGCASIRVKIDFEHWADTLS
jgi:ribulose bisphosphate carboxylase small subunit